MSPHLVIEKTKLINSQALSGLHSQCFDRGWDSAEFQTYLDNPIMEFWCGFLDKELLGFLLLQVIEDQAEILTFCVCPEFQGQGFGQTILKSVIDDFKDNNGQEMILDVGKSNQAAIHIYTQFNFKPFAIRERYYQSKQGLQTDAVVMKLKIK